jgi:hypothetical protein
MLFFKADNPPQPYSFDFNVTDQRKYYFKGSGMTGYININLYEGVAFLNKNLYAMPDIHCTKPVKIALTSNDNDNACGSAFSKKLIKQMRKKVHEKFCNDLPQQPQEIFFECRQGFMTVFQSSLAAAYGSVGSASAVFSIIVLYIALKIFKLEPAAEEEGGGADENKKGDEETKKADDADMQTPAAVATKTPLVNDQEPLEETNIEVL